MLYCVTQDCERKELKPGYAVTAEEGMENSPTQPASFPCLSLNSALVDHSHQGTGRGMTISGHLRLHLVK